MFMKFCIAAAVALGCILAVPSASFAAGDKDKSATFFHHGTDGRQSCGA
jgi:hypothetical protein